MPRRRPADRWNRRPGPADRKRAGSVRVVTVVRRSLARQYSRRQDNGLTPGRRVRTTRSARSGDAGRSRHAPDDRRDHMSDVKTYMLLCQNDTREQARRAEQERRATLVAKLRRHDRRSERAAAPARLLRLTLL